MLRSLQNDSNPQSCDFRESKTLNKTSSTGFTHSGVDGLNEKTYGLSKSFTVSSNDKSGELLVDENQNDYKLPEDVAERLVRRTEMRVEQILLQSRFIREHCKLHALPRLEPEDMVVGEMIAHGGFSNVHEITSFRVCSPLDQKSHKDKQYIVKHLNPKLANDHKKLIVGAKDLVMEAHFLSALNHKNIIKLRGWSAAGVEGFAEKGRADGFFLIYDKLTETLGQRISSWRETAKSIKKGGLLVPVRIRANSNNQRIDLFKQRLEAAIDVASAVEYLHENRIVYRDLKPANIGFDQDGVLKIFDFGLAVELPPDADPNALYNLAGNTGTSRYMAVEVINKQPYNFKADVFSFSILLWEMIALLKPYDGICGQVVKERVSVLGERPVICKSWPTPLRRLLKRGWSESLRERPRMTEVRQILEKLHQTQCS